MSSFNSHTSSLGLNPPSPFVVERQASVQVMDANDNNNNNNNHHIPAYTPHHTNNNNNNNNYNNNNNHHVPAYITHHNFTQVPTGQQPLPYYYSVDQLMNQHQPVFGAENSFGPPEITPEDISFSEANDLIGKGSYGTVYSAQCRGHVVAVKIPLQQQISDADIRSFQDEVKFMSKLNHPNLIRLMGACTVRGRLQIVTEKCAGDLQGLLNDVTYTGSLYDRLKMARDTAAGMAWLHDVSKIIHGDLKPANLLIDAYNQVKITDFGFSLIKKDHPIEASTSKGTLIWMAPEKMLRKPFNEKVDVFSFGVILWEIVTRLKPYQHHSDPVTFCRAVCHAKERPPLTEDILPPLRVLIETCWHDDPNVRGSFREILYTLNSVMVDCVIQMPPAAEFWKSAFLQGQNFEYVEWTVFRNALKERLGGLENTFFDTLKNYLVETIKEGGKAVEVVTMNKFDKVTKWFGPFFVADPGIAIINEVNLLSQQPWFHGDISGEIANTCLSGRPRGTFLVRLSYSDPLNAPFALSLPKNVHVHMQRTQAGLLVQNAVYPSLEYFVHKNMEKLTTPCPKEYAPRYSDGAVYLQSI